MAFDLSLRRYRHAHDLHVVEIAVLDLIHDWIAHQWPQSFHYTFQKLLQSVRKSI